MTNWFLPFLQNLLGLLVRAGLCNPKVEKIKDERLCEMINFLTNILIYYTNLSSN